MPLLKSNYRAPWFLRNSHCHSIYPTLFRKVESMPYFRQRLELSDGDFVDLDWSESESQSDESKVAVICHGLEGSSQSHYVVGMARALKQAGWLTVCFNFRGCSGEPNRKLRSYHSGATEDLVEVLEAVLVRCPNAQVAFVGFSLGGNLVLKYLGEGDVHEQVCGCLAISVPCDLKSSALKLAVGFNQFYMARFMRFLLLKLEAKNRQLDANFDLEAFRKMKSFAEFDGAYTAPFHGFKDADHYWSEASSRQYLENIRVPTLLINAQDDPFLPEACYPVAEAERSQYFYLEIPNHGGHVGFYDRSSKEYYWHEARAVHFFNEHCEHNFINN